MSAAAPRRTVTQRAPRNAGTPSDAPVLVLVLVLVLVGAAGVSVALASGTVLLVAAVGVGLAALMVAPMWVFPPVVLLGTVVSDVARVEIGEDATAALFGQGRMIVALAGVVLVRVVLEQRPLRLPRLAAAALAAHIAAVCLAAVVGSAYGVFDLAEVQRAFSYALALFVGLAVAARREHLAPAFRGMAVVTVLAGALGLLYWGWATATLSPPGWLTAFFEDARRYAVANDLDPMRSRAPWVDHHPNRVGVLFALLLAFIAPALLASGRRGDVVLAALVTAAAVGGVLATQSRTGLVVLGAGAVAYLLLLLRRGSGQGPVVATLLAAIPGVWLLYTSLPQSRTLSLQTENFQSRQEVWADAWDAFASAPFLGHGLNYAGQSRFGVGLSAHNEYLAQVVDGGVLGGLLFLTMLAAFVALAWRLAHRAGVEGGAGTGMLVLLAVLALSMTVGTTWRTAVPAILTWMCAGFIAARVAAGVTASDTPDDTQPPEGAPPLEVR